MNLIKGENSIETLLPFIKATLYDRALVKKISSLTLYLGSPGTVTLFPCESALHLILIPKSLKKEDNNL